MSAAERERQFRDPFMLFWVLHHIGQSALYLDQFEDFSIATVETSLFPGLPHKRTLNCIMSRIPVERCETSRG
jgi:hypothetical protein